MNKNNLSCDVLMKKTSLNHFLLIMRTTIFLLFTCVFISVAETGYTQNAKVTLNKSSVDLKEVLNEIENQTDYLFIYNNEVNTNKTVSVKTKNGTVKTVLNHVLQDSNIDFSMEGNHIILSYLEKRLNEKNEDIVEKAQQQKKNITGKVVDINGEPIIGANIIEKGTSNGTITDIDGDFSLTVSNGAFLRISYIGYLEQEVATEDRNTINIELLEDTKSLEELVVVGYGVQKKENLAGAISSISADEIQSVHAADISNAISGRLPGAVVIQPSGEPGRNEARVLVRGRTTLGDNTAPLIVVDGVPGRSMYELDPNDIESISILKDASAAIYGSSAANGVILVTTKTGEGKSLSYSFYQGYKTPTILPKAANAGEYSQYISDYQDYEGLARLYSDKDIELYKSGRDPWEHPQSDWMGDLVKDWTTETRHNVSLSGSGDRATYYASFGYNRDEAFYKQANPSPNYEQYNTRLRVSVPVTDWFDTAIQYGGTLAKRKYPTTGTYEIIGWASLVVPTEPSFWPTGEPGPDFEAGVNPVVNSSFEAGYDQINNTKNELTFSFALRPPMIEGLTLNSFYTYDVNNQNNKRFKKPWTLYYPLFDTAVRDSEGFITSMDLEPRLRGLDSPELTEYNYKHERKLFNVSATYEREFGDHSFSIFGAFEQLDERSNYFDAYRKYYISDLVQTIDAGGTKDMSNSGGMSIYARQSWIGRLNYNYKEKYLAEFIFRRDGSLKFPSNSRWGNFPALLGAWRISEENFWKENISIFDYFKLRGSIGKIGMDPGSPFQYINKYALGAGMTFGDSKDVVTKIYQSTVANPNITWEEQTTYNIGFDSYLLDQMFHLNAEVFYNNRSDILVARDASVPAYTGLSLPSENIAEVENKGFEIDLGFHKNLTKDLKLDISGNFSYNKNEVIFMDEPQRAVPWQVRTGHSYGVHLVYNALGIFKTQGEVDNYPHWKGAKPGDVIFEDVNKDGVIDADDRILLDKTDAPQIFYGIKVDLTYKNWALSVLGQGQGSYYRSTVGGNRGIGQNVYQWMATDNWTPENSNSDVARAFHRADQYWSYAANGNTYWYDNMAYFRLKNAVISYSLPKSITQVVGMQNASVFLSGNNLFLIYSAQRNYDPEVGNPQAYPAMKTISIGARVTF